MAETTKIKMGHTLTIDLGDRGFRELGQECETEVPSGATRAEIEYAITAITLQANIAAGRQAQALLEEIQSESPRDTSIPTSTLELLELIAEEADPGYAGSETLAWNQAIRGRGLAN